MLREGILEAYTGIIQGLKDGNRTELLLPYIDAIMSFLEMISKTRKNDYDNEVLSKAVGLIGMTLCFGLAGASFGWFVGRSIKGLKNLRQKI